MNITCSNAVYLTFKEEMEKSKRKKFKYDMVEIGEDSANSKVF